MSKVENIIQALYAQGLGKQATSPAEAEAFMNKAFELIKKHNLSEDVLNGSSDPVDEEVFEIVADRTWYRSLATTTAMLYFSVAYMHEYIDTKAPLKLTPKGPEWTYKKSYNFVGKEHNRKVATLMYRYFYDTIHRFAKEFSDKKPVQNEFIKGACLRLATRIMDKVRQERGEESREPIKGSVAAIGCHALVASMDSDRISAQNWIDNKTGKNIAIRDGRTMITTDLLKGAETANSISLNTQVNYNPTKGLLK